MANRIERCGDCGGGGRQEREICSTCNGSGDNTIHLSQTKEFQKAVDAAVEKKLAGLEKAIVERANEKAAKKAADAIAKAAKKKG